MNSIRSNAEFRRQRARLVDQIRARLHADNASTAGGAKDQVVKNKAQIGFSGADIREDRIGSVFQNFFQRRPQQLRQVQHLFELAAGIGIERAVARQDVQRLQQRGGFLRPCARPELRPDVFRCGCLAFAHVGISLST